MHRLCQARPMRRTGPFELYWERVCAINSWRWKVAAQESRRTHMMGGNQRLFEELLVHVRHSPRMNRPDHLT